MGIVIGGGLAGAALTSALGFLVRSRAIRSQRVLTLALRLTTTRRSPQYHTALLQRYGFGAAQRRTFCRFHAFLSSRVLRVDLHRITTGLYYNLHSLKSRGLGFNPNTDSVLRKLGSLAIRTAAYTAGVAVAGAVASVAIPLNTRKN